MRILLLAWILAGSLSAQMYPSPGPASRAPAAGGSPEIIFDAASGGTNATVTSLTFSHTTGSGSNRAIVCAVGIDVNTTVSATYNGVSMGSAIWNILGTNGVPYRSVGFVLVAPASGAHNAVFTFGAAVDTVGGSCTSWEGVNQSTPNRTAATIDDFTTSPARVVVSNAQSGDVVVDNIMVSVAAITAVGTSRNKHEAIAGGSSSQGMQSTVASGSTNMDWTIGAGGIYVIGAAALIPN